MLSNWRRQDRERSSSTIWTNITSWKGSKKLKNIIWSISQKSCSWKSRWKDKMLTTPLRTSQHWTYKTIFTHTHWSELRNTHIHTLPTNVPSEHDSDDEPFSPRNWTAAQRRDFQFGESSDDGDRNMRKGLEFAIQCIYQDTIPTRTTHMCSYMFNVSEIARSHTISRSLFVSKDMHRWLTVDKWSTSTKRSRLRRQDFQKKRFFNDLVVITWRAAK